MAKFVHLHTHSHYSLLDGLAKIDDLIARAKEHGMDSLALTDHGVLYGAVEFYKKATKAGIKPILGVETYVAPRDRFSREPGERYFHLILLAENQKGWQNLIALVTKAHLEGFYYKPRVDKELLRAHHEGLIALSACLSGEVNRSILAGDMNGAERIAREYEDIFGKGSYFLEIGHHPNIPETIRVNEGAIALAQKTGIPLVATQDIHYVRPEDAEYHDILLAVQTGNKLSDDDRLTLKADDFSLNSADDMEKKFAYVPEAIANTLRIAERCNVDLELGKIQLPDFPKPPGMTGDEYLTQLVAERTNTRYAPEAETQAVRDRIAYELDIIKKTGFADYFLIVADLVQWAKVHGISVGPGRGSAAGSIVSYILGITDLDPLAYGLLFERFLNPDRVQMPDIDIDFADTRRDEVLAYAREKYGEGHVAQIITFGTMAARAAVRDAGRALGLSYAFCDQIAKLIPFNAKLKDAIEAVSELKELYETNDDAKKVLNAAAHLEGVARHASVHACGTVISKEPVSLRAPLQFAPQDKSNIITQYEMHAIEDLGLLKIDLLGLKNLTIIQDTLRLIKDRAGEDIAISGIPLDDQKTFELLRSGDTTGVFQFESSGMRRYMKEIKPTRLEDLIALVALFRPGPMELIPSFIKRKHGEEHITYIHPKLEPILADTHGIGVYQEQMMRIARDLAGYTLAEADTLRKAIGKKIKSLLDEQKEKLIHGMMKNGIEQKTAKAIWELFPPFARYGFNKSHAACYALIGYRTAYLKTHFPVEFMTSLLNAEVSDTDRISFLVSEAKHTGIEVLAPDINKSGVFFAPDGASTDRRIRFGLRAIKNVGEHITEHIIEERAMRGEFKDLNDFLMRVQHKDLNKKSLESLARSGALDSFGIERNQLFQNTEEMIRFASAIKRSGNLSSSLFATGTLVAHALKLKPVPPAHEDEKLSWEKELLGLYISDHPLKRHANKMKEFKAKPLADALRVKDEKTPFIIAGIVSKIQKIFTKKGEPMIFVKLEDLSSQPLEVIVFNDTLSKTLPVWKENNTVFVRGRMSWRNGEGKMIAEAAQELTS